MPTGKVNSETIRRGIYLLPNLFTTAGLFAGFYSIVAAMKGQFSLAAIAIFIAMIADGLDGRVARLTNTQSAFGVEYDSLADMLSFGVTPALLIYTFSLQGFGKVGWLVAFMLAAATALRLARFNTQAVSEAKKYFQGLACPASAGVIAGLVWTSVEFHLQSQALNIFALVVSICLAFSQVSNIRYHSLKQIDFKGKVPFMALLILVLLFVGVALDPAPILFAVFFLYALSGPVMTVLHRRKRRSLRRQAVKRRQEKLEHSQPEK